MKDQPSHERWMDLVTSLVDTIGSSVADGMVSGLEQSDLFGRIIQFIDVLQERVTDLESANSALDERLQCLERGHEAAELPSAVEPLAAKPPPRPPEPARPTPFQPSPAMPPPVPAVSPDRPAPPPLPPPMPTAPPLPFGLGVDALRRPSGGSVSVRRTRTRTSVRPTVVYRTDPRAQKSAESDDADGNLIRKPKLGVTPGEGLLPPPPPRASSKESGKRKEGTRGVFAMLYDEKGRRVLAGLVNQMKLDRKDLVERINKQFAGLPGIPLDEEDVIRVIHYHKLGDALRAKEGEILCRHLTKQRGSLVKTAQKMKIDPDQLKHRVEELGFDAEVGKIRNTFRELVLEKSSFSDRLDLALTREKYLKDLGIETEVDQSLMREIELQLGKLDPGSALAEAVRTTLGLDDQRFRRMVRRFKLEERLGISPEELEADAENPAEEDAPEGDG